MLKGRKFDDMETTHIAMDKLLFIPRTGFERCFQHRQEWWNMCMWLGSLLWRRLTFTV
jgi:hypothetical protein